MSGKAEFAMDGVKCTPSERQDPSPSIHREPYRYIIIGGGAAGCPLAAALAKKGKTLLLERGKAKEEEPKTDGCVLEKAVHWSRTEHGSWAATANVLGGGSAVNAGVFMKETRDSSFIKEHPFLEWEQVEKAYAELTDRLARERDSSTHFQTCVTEAMREAGLGLKDISTDTAHVGIYHPYTILRSQTDRHSAVFLLPKEGDSSFSNLTVRTNVLVTRILFDTHRSQPRAIGIEFQETGDNGQVSMKELIEPQAEFYLSGGALHSPQLLMLSGIGDADELKRHNIDSVLHNPDVGMHLKDKPLVAVSVMSSLPIDYTLVDTMAMTEDFQIGAVSGGHIASQMSTITLAMLPAAHRSAAKHRIMENVVRMLPKPLLKKFNQQFTFYLVLSNPTSEGTVALTSTDPAADVRVFNPGVSDPEEISALAKGLVAIRKVIDAVPLQKFRRDRSNPWSRMVMRGIGKLWSRWFQYGDKYLIGSHPVTFPMLPNLDSMLAAEQQLSGNGDEKMRQYFQVMPDVERWLKGMYSDGWNYTGTCRFGDVVNHDFTVEGVEGLSIVDASVLRRPPRVNAQATMMMLGLYAGYMARDNTAS
jgi:choline dehydrogenase-like flavoprotein